MSAERPEAWQDFQSRYSPEERRTILERLLGEGVLEFTCSACGLASFTMHPAQNQAVLECPACGRRTYIFREADRCTMFSEDRLTRLIGYARKKKWHCPEHEGLAVEPLRVEMDERNPRTARLHFVCSRRRSLFARRRHVGVIEFNLTALEAEMLADGL